MIKSESELMKKIQDYIDVKETSPSPDNAHQFIYVIEEMAELTKEFTKDVRNKGDLSRIAEECADVIVAILTYAVEMNIPFDAIWVGMMIKLNRGINFYYKENEV